MKDLFKNISEMLVENPHGWTREDQALEMASAIVATRPSISVEIGVYAGKGLISMALAHKAVDFGKVIGIDPYSNEAALEDEEDPAQREWWAKLDFSEIIRTRDEFINRYGVGNRCEVWNRRSRDVTPPAEIGVIRIDGNHNKEAYDDCVRFCSRVGRGGFVFLDDVAWGQKGYGHNAADWLINNGFRMLYNIETGYCYQRVK